MEEEELQKKIINLRYYVVGVMIFFLIGFLITKDMGNIIVILTILIFYIFMKIYILDKLNED